MKLILLLFLGTGYVYGNVVYSQQRENTGNDDKNMEEIIGLESSMQLTRNSAYNRYYLYTRQNPQVAHLLVMDDPASISNSNFNPRTMTVVIVHGLLENLNSDLNLNLAITEAFLEKREVNVIVMEWTRLASFGHVIASRGVPAVGVGLAEFLRFLNEQTGASFGNMHLIGLDLGAHLVGCAGRELHGLIARITGLNPSHNLWSLNPNKLSNTDARYVEAIYTNGAYNDGLFPNPNIANVIFYANGGDYQPGCWTSNCNHRRSWELFASTVRNDHLIGRQCSSDFQLTWNLCFGDEVAMGSDDLVKVGNGNFRVNTGRSYPF